ncbi:tRNA lysidine(34) synthetase TilS [Lactobacillus kefiranofaciens subsp. kefiranofaciens]
MTCNGSFFARQMKLIDFFKQNKIDLVNKKIVVAASAGPDSMALLDMLVKMQEKMHFKVLVAHFDHQLRNDSQQETEVLQNYCEKNKVSLFWAKWDKHPTSGVEAAARNARYAFLTRIVKKEGAAYLLTAHHGDDLLENILLKFIRSGNPEEMNSLQAVGQMNGVALVRPFLAYSKQQLLEYDQEYGINYIVDSTNRADETMRNRLRHHVVPLLKKENPALLANALRFSRQMHELTDFANKRIVQIGKTTKFLTAYRIESQQLANLTELERKIFWQRIIWQKYQRRVNQNLGNFVVIEYQGYFYLLKKEKKVVVQPKKILLDQPFMFKNRKFILTTTKKPEMQSIGDFWFKKNSCFAAGSLIPEKKLLLKNGQLTKAKKKFAENAIPLALRPLCLTIYTDNEPVWVEKTYQNQNWLSNAKHYFLYEL